MGVILLVRHGQASFGGPDYDVLSPLGERQARCAGVALAKRGVRPAALVCGSLRRQHDSALAMASEAGWDLEPVIDPGWNEFDFRGLAAAQRGDGGDDALEAGMRRWAAGEQAIGESFASFAARTTAALDAVAAAQPRGATTVVATSAGVIGWLTATLLAAGPEQWIRVNRVCVNAGITTIVSGRRGISLVALNDHAHLPPAEVTYR